MTSADEHDEQDHANEEPSARRREIRRRAANAMIVADMEARLERVEKRNRTQGVSPTILTGAVALAAFVFSVMSLLNSSTQDKIDRGTAPLAMQVTEMDKRLTGSLDAVDRSLERVNTKLDGIESRMSNVELRLERIDSKLTK